GFPIRKSSDHGPLADSPRLIAGCYVLLRLLMPRHPPIALINLPQKSKMLASTVQFSSYGRFHAYLRLPQQGRFDQVVMDRQSEVTGRSPFPQDPTVCQATRVDR